MIRTIAWHLSGFVIFGLMAWGVLTLLIMLPPHQSWWAAWAVAGSMIVRTILFISAAACGWLAIAWLISPAEADE